MDRSMERQVAGRVRTGRSRCVSGLALELVSENVHFQDSQRDFEFRPGTQLPPTRAARMPRSRGVFSRANEPPKKQSAWRRADLSIVALAVAVVAIVSALIVGAPTAVMDGAFNHNPGPAIVGAASVPPAFIARSRKR
jgi:hypothetical protein